MGITSTNDTSNTLADTFACADCGAVFQLSSLDAIEDTIEFCPFCGEAFQDLSDDD